MSEQTNLFELECRVEMRNYLTAGMKEQPLSGAEAEYHAALHLPPDTLPHFPMRLLDPQHPIHRTWNPETRADAVTNLAADQAEVMQASYAPRIFNATLARFLGVTFLSADQGEQYGSYMESARTAPKPVGRGVEQDAEDMSWKAKKLEPVRMPNAVVLQLEDLARTGWLEQRVMEDFTQAFSQAVDNYCTKPDADLTETGGLLAIAKEISVELEDNPTEAHVAEWVSKAIILRDNYGSAMDGMASVAIHPYVWNQMVEQNFKSQWGLFSELMSMGIFIRPWPGLGAPTAEPAVNAIWGMIARANTQGLALCMTWPSFPLIRDQFTLAAKGQIRLTANGFMDFAVMNIADAQNPWTKFKNAA